MTDLEKIQRFLTVCGYKTDSTSKAVLVWGKCMQNKKFNLAAKIADNYNLGFELNDKTIKASELSLNPSMINEFF